MYNLLENTLAALSVRHTKAFVNKVYDKDPDRDNMLGLSRMLRLFGVESSGYMCEGLEQLLSETKPFIAALGRSFSLVLSIDKDQVFLDDSKGKRRIGIGEFRKVWTGAVLLLEKSAEACEPEIESHVHEERNERLKQMALVASAGVMLILAVCRLTDIYGIGEWLLFGLNVIAASVCGLLLEKHIKGKSSIGDKVCSALRKNGCSSILDSAAAKPFLSISWGEIGFGFFFTSSLLTLSVPATVHVVAIICLVSVGVSVWSLAYQAIRKEWCPLCVVVQLCVVFQCLDILFYGIANVDAWSPAHVWILLAYPIVILTVHYLVRYAEEYVTDKMEVKRMKPIVSDASVFNNLLKQQKHYEVSDDDSSIIIGNQEALNTLTVFSNPHCKACAEMHKALSMLINNSKGIKLQYIFTSLGKNNEQDCLFLIESFIKDKLSFPELLDKWYASGRKHHYSNLPKESFKDDTINQYYSHTRCFDRCQFHMTPVVLLNGFALPRGYPILELQYLDFSSIHMGREG